MRARDTQFAAFASLLMQEIDNHVGAVTAWGVEHDADEEKIGRELSSRWQKTIANRAYDLVQHTIGYSLEYLHECGHELSGGTGKRIVSAIPDMTTWPEDDRAESREIQTEMQGIAFRCIQCEKQYHIVWRNDADNSKTHILPVDGEAP